MKPKRAGLISIGISLVYFIAFNIIAFVLTGKIGKNFWCGYIFITLAWICLVITEILDARDNAVESGFINAPGLLVTGIHLIVQTILGIVVMAIPNYSIKVSVVMEILIFAIYLILMGLLSIYKTKSIQ